MSASPVFQLEGVSCRFGAVAALTDCSLTVAAGERVALIGPSGAGKSTLLSLLNGSQVPTAGRVVMLGQDVSRLSTRQRRRLQRLVGTVYQQHHLVGNLAALTDCSLTIAAGERVALIGPSGAGKSTLLSLLNGSQVPTAGRVVMLGQDVSRLSPRQRRRLQRLVGTVYQQHHLVGNLAVVHNVNAGHLGRWPLPLALWSLVWPQAVPQAAAALAQVGIVDRLYARTDRLSGGQQQRVALARVLVQDPAAILADEPISSVDPERSRAMMDLLRQLSETTGKTLVISLHEVDVAIKYCDRIIGLRQGQILFDAPAAQVSDAMLTALYQL